MHSLQESCNFESLIDRWMQQEMQGIQFPADFDLVWRMTGYSTKSP